MIKTMNHLHYGLLIGLSTIGVNAMSGEAAHGNPKTLFEIVGAAQPKLAWSDSVLVIIDAQREYETGVLALPNVRPAIQAIKTLLLEARRQRVPVIHVLHEGQKGLFDPLGDGFKSIVALTPENGEITIRKHLPNTFAGTELQKILEGVGKDKKLILTGFMTHMCVSATAMAALDLGYATFVVRDAVATRALKGANGNTIPASEVNESSLAALKDRISWVIHSNELLKK